MSVEVPLALTLRPPKCGLLVSLRPIRGLNLVPHGVLVLPHELQELVLHREHGAHTNFVILEFKQWGDLFKPKYLRRTTVALAIPFFQQVSGEHSGAIAPQWQQY